MNNLDSRSIYGIERRIRQHMASYGYQSIELPEIADADLFLTRAGDKIIDHLLTFERMGQRFALRPEFTALAAQLYASKRLTKPVRWQFSGTVYEDDIESLEHVYQTASMGAEFIGAASFHADAEIIAMAVDGLQALGINDWELVIGHVGIQKQLLNALNIGSRIQEILLSQRDLYKRQSEFPPALNSINLVSYEAENDGLKNYGQMPKTYDATYALELLLSTTKYGETMGGRDRQDITQRLLQKHERQSIRTQLERAWQILTIWSQIEAPLSDAFALIQTTLGEFGINDPVLDHLMDEWQQMIRLLEHYDIPSTKIVIQPDLTRNWNYYTGSVFGIRIGKENYLASGGRYDDLVRIVSADKYHAPAVGYALYPGRIPDSYFAQYTDSATRINLIGDNNMIPLAQTLRKQFPLTQIIIGNDADSRIRIEGNQCVLVDDQDKVVETIKFDSSAELIDILQNIFKKESDS